MIEITAIGNSGRIVILWDDTLLDLEEITTTNQEIDAMIKVCFNHTTWLFSCIYASNLK